MRGWLEWLVADGRLIPMVETTSPTCDACRGAVTENRDGEPWLICYKCSQETLLRRHLQGLVSVTYSTNQTFEPLVADFKDDRRRRWQGLPLGALLYRFLDIHARCIEHVFGTLDVWTVVPSHPGSRDGFDHMKRMATAVKAWRSLGPWELDLLERTRRDKGGRTVDPTMYRATQPLAGERVLLIDDTFTTGATICSAATALRRDGAEDVVGLTLGRQLRLDFGSARNIVREQSAKPFDFNSCVLE